MQRTGEHSSLEAQGHCLQFCMENEWVICAWHLLMKGEAKSLKTHKKTPRPHFMRVHEHRGGKEDWLLTQGFWVLWTNSPVILINITKAKQEGFLRIDLWAQSGNHSAWLPTMWPHHCWCCALNTREGNLQWCEGAQSISWGPWALRREQMECCRLQFANAAQLLLR